jgi:endonuclease YncB( thermonuclease family)
LAALILNKAVTILEYGRDRYGRVLAVVFLNGTNITWKWLKGLAEVYQGTPAPDLTTSRTLKAERMAQAAGRKCGTGGQIR